MLNLAYVLLGAAFMLGALHIWRRFTIPKSDRCPHCGGILHVTAATDNGWLFTCTRCGHGIARGEL